MIEPGARAAVAARPGGRHLVLATEATVRLHAYRDAVRRLDTAAATRELPCEMLVALAEEGWTGGSIAAAVVRRYLEPFLEEDATARPESLILGCTHFPLLADVLRQVAGDRVSIVDSAATTAVAVAGLLGEGARPAPPGDGTLRLLATDGARRFARVGGAFLGTALAPDDVELVDL